MKISPLAFLAMMALSLGTATAQAAISSALDLELVTPEKKLDVTTAEAQAAISSIFSKAGGVNQWVLVKQATFKATSGSEKNPRTDLWSDSWTGHHYYHGKKDPTFTTEASKEQDISSLVKFEQEIAHLLSHMPTAALLLSVQDTRCHFGFTVGPRQHRFLQETCREDGHGLYSFSVIWDLSADNTLIKGAGEVDHRHPDQHVIELFTYENLQTVHGLQTPFEIIVKRPLAASSKTELSDVTFTF